MAGWPPKRATAFDLVTVIRDADGDPIADPTGLAAVISKDTGAQAATTNTPAVVSAGSAMVKLTLTATEMTADVVAVVISSTSTGAKSAFVLLYTSTRQIDDLMFPAVSGRSTQVETDGMVHGDVKEWLGAAPLALVSQLVQAQANQLAAQAKADVNAEVDAALDTAVPGVPTADSINERIKTLDDAGIPARLPAALIGGRMDANAQVVGDKTGYALAAAEYAALVNSIWDELTAEARTAGSYGQLFKDNVNATISSRAAPGAAMALVTDALDAVSLAAAAVDEIWDEVFPELAQAIPAATPTARAAIMLLYMALRNKLDVDASFKEVHNDAGTVITKKAVSDDGTTYSEAEMVAGP